VGIGYGATTVTFWYEDDSWIRTQRFVETYPDVAKLLNTPVNAIPFPIGLFSAAKQLAPFSEDGRIYCANGKASSHAFGKADTFNARLTLDVSGINASRIYMLESIKHVEKYIQRYDDQVMPKRTFFYGGAEIKLGTRKADVARIQVRGVMTHDSEDVMPIDPTAPVYIGGMPASNAGPCGCGSGLMTNACDCIPF
jgi:hypothetical protein